MKNEQCVCFLQWALPQLRMRWPGFRKVRKQVCKRVGQHMRELGLADVEEYRTYLEAHSDEWACLDALCRITISRFYRDRAVFAVLAQEVLPSLAVVVRERDDDTLRIWSAGCGSGEEPYTLAVLWSTELQSRFSDMSIEIVATDADPDVLRRAHDARYEFSSLKDLPVSWRDRAFTRQGDGYFLKPEYRHDVRFLKQDIRVEQPEALFDLVLCRNLVFTYFDDALQLQLLRRIVSTMQNGAALVLGVHERVPAGIQGLSVWFDKQRVYRRISQSIMNQSEKSD